MVHPCVVKGCKNKSADGIFRFPKDEFTRGIWLQNLMLLPEEINDLSRVCGRHFKPEAFQRDLKGELLGIPSKRKRLVEGQSGYPKPQIHCQIHSRIFFLLDAIPSLDTLTNPAMVAANEKATNYPSIRKFRNLVKRPIVPRTKTELKQFVKQKEALLKEIKHEAAMKVKKDKLLRPDPPPDITSLPPQPCVILQPISGEEVDPMEGQRQAALPVIIPGNPEESMVMLKDRKVQELIESQLASSDSSSSPNHVDPLSRPSAILLQTIGSSEKQPKLAPPPPPPVRTGYVPLKMKQERVDDQPPPEVDPTHILSTVWSLKKFLINIPGCQANLGRSVSAHGVVNAVLLNNTGVMQCLR